MNRKVLQLPCEYHIPFDCEEYDVNHQWISRTFVFKHSGRKRGLYYWEHVYGREGEYAMMVCYKFAKLVWTCRIRSCVVCK